MNATTAEFLRRITRNPSLIALLVFVGLGLSLVWPALKRGEEAVIGQRFDNYWIWNLKPRIAYNQENSLPWRDDVLIGYPYHLLRPELEPFQPFLYTVLLQVLGPATIVNLLGLFALTASGYFTFRLITFFTNVPLLGLAAGATFLYRLIPAIDGNMWFLPLLFFPPLVYATLRLLQAVRDEGTDPLPRRAALLLSLLGLLCFLWQGFHQLYWLKASPEQTLISLLIILLGVGLLPTIYLWLGRTRHAYQSVYLWSALIGILTTFIATTKIEFTIFAAAFVVSAALIGVVLTVMRQVKWRSLGLATLTCGLTLLVLYGPFFISLWRELHMSGQSLGGVRPVTLEEIKEFSPSLREVVDLNQPVILFVGVCVFLLIIGWLRKEQESLSTRFWLLISLLLLAAAIFSTVEPSGPFSLAYWLHQAGIESLRRYGNNLYLVWLLYFIVASLGLSLMLKFAQKSQSWRLGVLVASVLVLLSGLPEAGKRRLPIQELITPPVYAWLTDRPESVVAEYPLAPAIDQVTTEMFAWQGVHQKALIGGLDLKDEPSYSGLQALNKDTVDHLSLLGAELLIIYPHLDQQITNAQVGEQLYYQFPRLEVPDDETLTNLGLERLQVFGKETGREAVVFRISPRPYAGAFSEQPHITPLLEDGRGVSGASLELRGVTYAENEGSFRGEGELILQHQVLELGSGSRLQELWIETYLPGPSQATISIAAGKTGGRLKEVTTIANEGRISYARRVIINPENYVSADLPFELRVTFSADGGPIEPRLKKIELVEY